MRKYIYILMFIFSLSLTGLLHADPDQEYLKARNGKLIRVPAPLSDAKFSDYFVIPETKVQPGKTPVPPGSALEKHTQQYPAQQPGLPAEAVSFTTINGEPTLKLNQRLPQAKQTVRAALLRQAFKIEGYQGSGLMVSLGSVKRAHRKKYLGTWLITLTPQDYETMIRVRDQKNQRVKPAVSAQILDQIQSGIKGAMKHRIGWL